MAELLLHESKSVKTYLVKDSKWGQAVIKKVLTNEQASENEVMEFKNELDLLQSLSIKGIQKGIGLETENGRPAIYYEYFEGFSIKQLIKTGQLSLENILKISRSIAEVLAPLHDIKLIHKNINSHSILVNTDNWDIQVIDFSLANRIKDKLNHLGNPNQIKGELNYISPEQTGRTNRMVDVRSDLYSMGVVMYEMIAGRLPFSGAEALELVHAHLAKVPEPLSHYIREIPQPVVAIVAKLLNKNVEDRYQSAVGLIYDIDKCITYLGKKGSIRNFAIGEHDFSPFLGISQKLYGREKEVNELRNLVICLNESNVQLALIDGYSGVGKTALVHELFRDISFNKGFFIKGKYDQLQRDIPFYAITKALQEFSNFVCSEENNIRLKYKTAIEQAVGNEGSILLEVVPALYHLIGKQPDIELLSGLEAQNRFNYIFSSFFKAICTPERPIVLFIDDLQWADISSLQLLSQIVRDPKLKHLLIIGSYRSNEVSSGHPLMEMMDELNKENIAISNYSLDNLSNLNVSELVSDSLHLDVAKVDSLSRIIYSKTYGNPFHVIQILKTLYENNILYLNLEKQEWVWNIDKVEKLNLTDNVIDLLVRELDSLDDLCLNVLKTASCIGGHFAEQNLNMVYEGDNSEVYQALLTAQMEGLITKNQNEYSFVHDKIQQAVYSMIPDSQKSALHLKIGTYFLEKLNIAENEDRIFDIINQLNKGIELVDDLSRRDTYADLNFIAAKKSKASSAYTSAFSYAIKGLDLIQQDWDKNHKKLIDLYTICAESAYLSGDFASVEKYLLPVSTHAKSILEQLPVYEIRIEALKSQNKLTEAINEGIDALSELGIYIPKKPSKQRVFQKLILTRISLIGKNINYLENLPAIQREDKKAAIRLMVAIGPAIYWSDPELIGPMIFEMVMLTVKYGNSDEAVFAYSTYALLLCGVTGEIALGNQYGQLSLRLAEHVSLKNKVKGIFNVYCFVDHWTNPIKNSFDPFRKNFRQGLEAGDLEFSALSAYLYCNHKFYQGENLARLDKEMESFNHEIGQIKQNTPHNYLLIHWQMLKNLRGETDNPLVLSGSVYNEQVMLDIHIQAKDSTALFKFYMQKMVLQYWMGEITVAAEFGEKGKPHIEATTGMLVTVVYWFYYGLVHARLNDPAHQSDKKFKKAIKHLKKWSGHAPQNHLQKYNLLRAEKARLDGNNDQAIFYYESAIKTAKENGFVQDEGLSYELAGRFYQTIEKKTLSDFYLINAFISYKNWGAERLANSIRYQYKLDDFVNYYFQNLNKGFQLEAGDDVLKNLDTRTIIKASTAISGDIENERLNESLLKIVVQNAGAQSGHLLIRQEDDFFIEQSWPVNTGKDKEKLSVSTNIPKTVINWVIQSGESINAQNAMEDTRWESDPYISGNNVKSFFGLPVKYQGDLIGVIYLENNVAYGAFTEEREELMEMLSGQIAVTLRNASLYNNLNLSLKEQVNLKEAYSKFVPKDILKFLGKESILDVALGDQVLEKVSIMFMDIRDYTRLSETMTPRDNFNFINGYLERVGPIIEKNDGFICQFLGDGFMAIFKGKVNDALNAAVLIQKEIMDYNVLRREKGRADISVGIGLHFGPVMLGIIGDQYRMDQNVISDQVNVASRVQGLTKMYNTSILLTSSIVQEMSHEANYHFRELGKVILKGKKEEIEIIECLEGLDALTREKKIASLPLFREGLKSYFMKDFGQATLNFEIVIKQNMDDKAALYYLKRAAMLLTDGVPEGWTGIEIMETK